MDFLDSYQSNNGIGSLFSIMFSGSEVADTFSCGEDKTAYLAKYGLAPFIKKQLMYQVSDDNFVLMFDESLNETTKNKQLDVHVRFWVWDENGARVQSRYLESQFMGHSTAQDLLTHFKVCCIISSNQLFICLTSICSRVICNFCFRANADLIVSATIHRADRRFIDVRRGKQSVVMSVSTLLRANMYRFSVLKCYLYEI